MKITCQSCQAKYTIADEKVAGKTVKIKCKKCGATIVVNGNEVAAAPVPAMAAAQAAAGYPPPPGDDEDDGEGATRVVSEGAAGGGVGSVEWTVNVTDEDQRTMNAAQIVIEYQRGVVNDDTYVWKDGMSDWLPLAQVPELKAMVSLVAPQPVAAVPAPMPEPSGGLGGTMIMNEPVAPLAASPAASPAAARRKAPGPGVDLFGPAAQAEAAPAAASSATTNAQRLAGERNENSMLFSISALTAAAGAGKKGGDDPFDLGPAPQQQNGGRAAVDDIMNLGGGIAAAPVLAPPPLLAPVVEAPPPPPPVVAPAMSMPVAIPAAPPQKSKTGLIIGLVVGVGLLASVGTFLAVGGGSKGTGAEATNAAAATSVAQAPSATAATTADSKPAEAKPADTGATADAKPADDKKADDKKPDDKKADAKKEEPKKAEEPKKDDKKADTGGAGKEFDRAAAMGALSAAAGAARGCKKDDTPSGSGKVRVTFAPSGRVTTATLESGPWAGTPAAGCIAGAFRGAHVPPFDGAPVAVSKTISIR